VLESNQMGSPRCGEGGGCLQGSRLCEEGKGMKEEFGCRLRCSGLLAKGKKKGKVGEVRPGSRLRGRGGPAAERGVATAV
jgi:hypothetical protein